MSRSYEIFRAAYTGQGGMIMKIVIVGYGTMGHLLLSRIEEKEDLQCVGLIASSYYQEISRAAAASRGDRRRQSSGQFRPDRTGDAASADSAGFGDDGVQ